MHGLNTMSGSAERSEREGRRAFWDAWRTRGWTQVERNANGVGFFIVSTGEQIPSEIYGKCPHWFIEDYGIVDLTKADRAVAEVKG